MKTIYDGINFNDNVSVTKLNPTTNAGLLRYSRKIKQLTLKRTIAEVKDKQLNSIEYKHCT